MGQQSHPTAVSEGARGTDAGAVSFRKLLYMYGAVTQIELNNFLDAHSIDSEQTKREIKVQWRDAASVFRNLVSAEAGEPDTIRTEPLSPEANQFVDELQEMAAFKQTLANYPISFEQIEIEKVVASQRTVHSEFVEAIRSRHGNSPSDLLDFCLHPGRDETPLQVGRTAANAFTFSSINPSLRFLGSYEEPFKPTEVLAHHPGGQPIHTVTLLVGFGISTINVFKVGQRIILNNGFHRLYALRAMGFQFAPAVVQHVTHPDLEMPPRIADLPREYLVQAPRPGLIRDFFDERLVCEIRQRNFLKSLQVGWGTNEVMVPL